MQRKLHVHVHGRSYMYIYNAMYMYVITLLVGLQPEWYFTQVSGWIGDHTYFLENTVQPLLIELDCAHIDARVRLFNLTIFTYGKYRIMVMVVTPTNIAFISRLSLFVGSSKR